MRYKTATRAKLSVERLEDRSLPSRFTMDDLLDELLRKTGHYGAVNIEQSSHSDQEAHNRASQGGGQGDSPTAKAFSQVGQYAIATASDSMLPTWTATVGIAPGVGIASASTLGGTTFASTPESRNNSASTPTPRVGIASTSAEVIKPQSQASSNGAQISIGSSGNQSVIPVNANNTNGSAWATVNGVAQPGIPSVRDFQAVNLPTDDPELVHCTVVFDGLATQVDVTYQTQANQTGKLAFWRDAKKITPASGTTFGGGTQLFSFYIEGLHESSAVSDVTMTVTGTTASGSKLTGDAVLTVVPIVNSLSVTPGFGLQFVDGSTLSEGVTTTDGTTPGASFSGQSTIGDGTDNINGSLRFIQNVTDVKNGYSAGGDGWQYVMDSGYTNKNVLPGAGQSFPFVDYSATGPTYDAGFVSSATLTTIDIGAYDSPATGVPVAGAGLNNERVDFRDEFRLYMVWQYPDGSYYTIATITWEATFDVYLDATTMTYVFGGNAGVTASATYIRSNDDPITADPKANDVFSWR